MLALAVSRSETVGVPRTGPRRELLSTDAEIYGGGGGGNPGPLSTHRVAAHDRKLSLELTLPPLAALFLAREAAPPEAPGRKRSAKAEEEASRGERSAPRRRAQRRPPSGAAGD